MFELLEGCVEEGRQRPGTNGRSPGKMGQGAGELGSRKEGCGGVLADMPQEAWICQVLDVFGDSGEPFNLEEGECASCWTGDTEPLGVKDFKISETLEMEQAERGREFETPWKY